MILSNRRGKKSNFFGGNQFLPTGIAHPNLQLGLGPWSHARASEKRHNFHIYESNSPKHTERKK